LTRKTELVTKTIADEAKAELIKIEEEEKRKKPSVFMLGGSETIKGIKSKIKNIDINKDYELIFLGTPTWVGNPPPAINAFISKTDFTSKKLLFSLLWALQEETE
jgi:flavodoxin